MNTAPPLLYFLEVQNAEIERKNAIISVHLLFLDNGFRAGYLIGKYGQDYVENVEKEQRFDEMTRMFWESRDAWESYLKSSMESAEKTRFIMKG